MSNTNTETLEKLELGIQLLQDANLTSSEKPDFATLNFNSPLSDYIHVLQILTEYATTHDIYGLQDACLLLEDALYELSADSFTDIKQNLLTSLNQWSAASISSPSPVQANVSPFDEHIHTIEQTAQQLTTAGYSSLSDISAIIIEALHELTQTGIKSDLPALLTQWPALINAYQQHDTNAIDGIMTILRHPDLNLPFAESDFATFATLLTEDITVQPTLAPAKTSPESVSRSAEADDEPAPTLSAETKELVELLNTEAELLTKQFLAIELSESVEKRTDCLQQTLEEIQRLIIAANLIGFPGLAVAAEHISANITLFLQNLDNFNEAKRQLLLDWTKHVKSYLTIFHKKTAGDALLKQMMQAAWPLPLPEAAYPVLLTQMQVKSFADSNGEQESKRKKTATDEDISLDLPDDVNKELLDLLLQELPNYTQQFSGAVQHLQAGGTSKDIDVAQRIAHTIKGSSNTVGIKGIAELTHQVEDILVACAKAHKQPTPALCNVLINTADCLEAMCESLLGLGDPPSDAKEVLQEVLDWANQIDKVGIQALDSIETSATASKQSSTKTSARADQPKTAAPKEENKAESAQATMVRVPTEQIENLFRLSGESIILNGQIYERQRRLTNQLQIMEAQFALLQQLGAELEQFIDLKDLSGRSFINTGEDFDALEMDQYNELHTASRRMVEAAVDAHEISEDMKKELEYMNEILEYQQRLVIDTQEAVMQTRFVPVGSIALRLQRGLRQTCRLTGKQGELSLTGEHLLIDGDTLNALVEPLMHLLRNAIDHGLETEPERIAAGKPPVGHIAIEFDREGNSIVIRCKDDGRGLDFASIRQIAEQRGDIQNGEILTDEQLKQLILRPNFSTRTELTQTSGRGVGMDVVNFQVLSLGGSLSLNSVQGQGLTVELKVPLPLSRSHALLAYAGPYKVAISSKGLSQVLYSEVGAIKTVGNEKMLVIGEDIYPVAKLENLLHIEDRRKRERPHAATLLVQHEGETTAVLVSAITDSREVVIKNLGYYIKKIHGFVGATILGDGSVTPVLDLPELLRSPSHAKMYKPATGAEIIDSNPKLPRILIVDDSLSQRRALEQILTDAGFHIHSARDGIEAAEWLDKVHPEAVITDLEMPRMNGIELAAHIRAQPRLKGLPIIMITSRSTQKHRQLAEEAGIDYYLVKPVQDDDLLIKLQALIDKQRAMVAT